MTTCPNTEGGGQAAPPFYGPVRVADEIDRIILLIQHYTALPNNDLAVLLACWIANTYTFQHFRYCGYVALRSATPQCGKTRLLRLIGSLAKGNRKPIAFPTAAVIFRCGWEVLLLDEVSRTRVSLVAEYRLVYVRRLATVGMHPGEQQDEPRSSRTESATWRKRGA